MKINLNPILDMLWANEYEMKIETTVNGNTVVLLRSADTYAILYNLYGDYILHYGKPSTSPVTQFKLLWESWLYRMDSSIQRMAAAMMADYDPLYQKQIQKYFASADQRDTVTDTYTPTGTKAETNAHTGSITDSGGADASIYGFNSASAVPSDSETNGNTRTFTNTDTKTDSFTDYTETREKSFANTLSMDTPAGTLEGNQTHFDYSEQYETENPAALISAELDLRFRDYCLDLIRQFVNENFYYVGAVSMYDD